MATRGTPPGTALSKRGLQNKSIEDGPAADSVPVDALTTAIAQIRRE
jgi:hypothetical protein